MGEILKFIIDNFNRLKPFDYFLIVLVASILSFGVFLIFRWLYSTYIKTQSDLIQLKEQAVSTYKAKAEELQETKHSLEIRIRQISSDSATFSMLYKAIGGSEDFTKE